MQKVLIIDDSSIIREIIKGLLKDKFDVLEAANGRDGLLMMYKNYQDLAAVLLDIQMPVLDGFGVLESRNSNPLLTLIPVIIISADDSEKAKEKARNLGAYDFIGKPLDGKEIKDTIEEAITFIKEDRIINSSKIDKLTGVLKRDYFMRAVKKKVNEQKPSFYVLSSINIDNFKVINEQYGIEIGDQVLKHVALTLKNFVEKCDGLIGRITADEFVALFPFSVIDSPDLEHSHGIAISPLCLPSKIHLRIGRMVISDKSLTPDQMYDRTRVASEKARKNYGEYIQVFDESMLKALIKGQNITSDMEKAIINNEFEPWYQPQYNHSTGALIGAEALVRWKKGDMYLSPSDFIPIFEENGFIYRMDAYIWERVCKFLKKLIDEKKNPLPISVNISRYDFFQKDFISKLTSLISEYGIPVELLRLEITESAFSETSKTIIEKVKQLIDFGFTIEIDDFGSGYSSLNTLKDVPASIMKLDMRFFENSKDNQRSGNIVEAVVRMAKWINMTVIAEGVETLEQADYLKSLGCNYIQGYVYSKPIKEKDYEILLIKNAKKEFELNKIDALKNLNNSEFWNPKSVETLIFNSYIGGACVFEYFDGTTEILRTNDSFSKEMNGLLPKERLFSKNDLTALLSEESRDVLYNTVKRSVHEKVEESCELAFNNGDKIEYIRFTVRLIAMTGQRYLFYAVVLNMTEQREAEQKQHENAKVLEVIMNNVNNGISATYLKEGKTEVLFANDRFYSIIDCDKDTFLAMNDGLALTPIIEEDREMIAKKILNFYQTRSDGDVVFRVRKKDGTIAWISSNIISTNIAGIDSVVLISVFTDITEKLRKEDEQKSLLDNLAFGAALYHYKDQKIRTIHINARYWTLVNRQQTRTENDIIALDSVHPDDIKALKKEVADALKENRSVKIKCRILFGETLYRTFLLEAPHEKQLDGSELFFTTFTPLDEKEVSYQDIIPLALSSMMRTSEDFVYIKDRNFKYLSCSKSIADLFGIKSPKDIVGKDDSDFFPPEVVKRIQQDDLDIVTKKITITQKADVLIGVDGMEYSVIVNKYPLIDGTGKCIGIYAINQNITRIASAKSRIDFISSSIPGGLATFVIDGDVTKMVYCNEMFYSYSGYSREEFLEKSNEDNLFMLHGKDHEEFLMKYRDFIAKKIDNSTFSDTYQSHTKNNETKWMSIKAQLKLQANGKYLLNVIQFDVTDSVKKELELEKLAQIDSLTNVYNRDCFIRSFKERLAHMNKDKIHALLFLDMDDFKKINDTFGHATGDTVLQDVAKTIKETIRSNDMVGRMGGDEFMIFIDGMETHDDIKKLASTIIEAVRKCLSAKIDSSASIGIAFYDDDKMVFDDIYRMADIALYSAKNSKKGMYYVYDEKVK